MMEKKIYVGIDYCKLLCAFLIVFMHSVRGGAEYVYWVRDVLTTIAVPYFFIASGFFLGKGLSFAGPDNSLEYIKRYFNRLFVLYTAWSILVIPVSLLCIHMRYPDASWGFRILYLFRMYFLSGSCGIYWYILALLFNCWILFLSYIKKIPESLLWVVAIVSFIVGVIYNSGYYRYMLFFESIHVIFGSVNNFLHTGLIYMLIGYRLAFQKNSIKNIILLPLLFLFIIIRSLECRISDFQFVQLILAVLLFLISMQVEFGNTISSRWARRLSMALYLEHFPLLLLFDYYIRIHSFEIVFLMMIIICISLYLVMRHWLPDTVFRMFYGEQK